MHVDTIINKLDFLKGGRDSVKGSLWVTATILSISLEVPICFLLGYCVVVMDYWFSTTSPTLGHLIHLVVNLVLKQQHIM